MSPLARRLLDVFCGVGGASMGYAWAGFDVVGVDIEPHPAYPLPFVQADALEVLADDRWLVAFDIVHASPPCPLFSVVTTPTSRAKHPDLLAPTRAALIAARVPYIIENVPGAPMVSPLMLCGASFGLGTRCDDGVYRHLRRHRLFESNLAIMGPGCACPPSQPVGVHGQGGGLRYRADGTSRGYQSSAAEARRAMRIEWATNHKDVTDAIPPAYTEYLGRQVLMLDELTR